MPHLDAAAIDDDPAGLAFLRATIQPRPPSSLPPGLLPGEDRPGPPKAAPFLAADRQPEPRPALACEAL